MSTDRRRCPRCSTELIAGISDLGLDTELEVEALDAAAELVAVLAGRRTYTHHHGPDEIASRSAYRIRQRPAGTRPRTTVHAAHHCPERNRT